ncbi:serine hydrolase domain-containing protein [Bernardetia sp. Wsw4-3y2]|uniref:serine hydrolase domain-containing protein n=1 Tax=Bernardetia sp. Wsw4-3y2 TaxID=3127471 RepID=UPI0030D586FA
MKQIAFIYVALLITFSATSQNPTNLIDNLFIDWSTENNPGGVVLVTHQNNLVFTKAYGLANIPYQIPNTEESVFNIGSLSKQFTAMGIVLLYLDGKLSFDDDIKTYLPEFTDFGKTITIRQLLHHTSGLRAVPELFGLAGWRSGDAISNDDVYRYLLKQQDLNFEPNSEFMYSNSGYILLAKIIERISKQDFKSYMKEKVFQPLHLNSTFVEEDYSAIITKTANSYTETAPSFFQTVENNDLTYGASNVYSTSVDISNWAKNYTKAPKSWKKAFSILETLTTLNSGEKNNYAFGIVIDDFFGNRRIQHTGAIAGFQSIMYSYPDEDLQIIILSNFTSNQLSQKANQISQLFLQNKSKPTKIEEIKSSFKISIEALQKNEGMYWNNKNNYSRKIFVANDTLWYLRNNNQKSPLLPISETEFQMGGINEKLVIKFDIHSAKMTLIFANNSTETFEKYEDKLLTLEELKSYTGDFYSSELETFYTITLKDKSLYGYHSRFGEFEIQVLKRDVVNWSGMAISKYKRNGNSIGFWVTMNGIRNLWFEKK